MPSISKIRFTNVVYEEGMKRYNDEIFNFDGYNGAILLENGGGKTVFIQTALQAIIPHTNLSDRKIKQTLQLDNYPAHIAIEWILSEQPRRYVVTCVSLFLTKDGLGSYRYVYSYQHGDRHGIDDIPFVRKDSNRPADRGEISDYYQQMAQQQMNAQTFSTIKAFQRHIEEQYHIIANEWENIVKINSAEGGVEAFFDDCKQTNQLLDRLLIPTVEGAITGHEENSFADTFEKHRSSFKLYKELKEQIEENRAIEAELNGYVGTFARLYEMQQEYEQKKQYAKAVLNLIHNQEQENKSSLKVMEVKFAEWETQNRLHEKKVLSLKIQQEQSKLDELLARFHEYEQALEIGKEEFVQAKKHFYSLKLAELKRQHKEEQERLQSLNEKQETLDEEEDIEEIKDKIVANSEELMGYFVSQLEESQKRQQELKIQQQPLQEEIQQLEIQQNKEDEQLLQARNAFSQNKGKLDQITEQMTKVKNRILANPEQESVKESVGQWEKRLVFLDDRIVQLKNHNKQLSKMILQTKEKLVEITKRKESGEHAQIKLVSEIQHVDSQHAQVKSSLGQLRAPWAMIDSLYLKQDSLTQQIYDQIQRFYKETDERLYKERLAHRFMDDYEGQDMFFADSYVEKQLKQWSNQFHLIETGVQFIQSLGDTVTEQAKAYPLWPVTLITTEGDKEGIRKKLQHLNQQLQFPVVVITIEQARKIVQGETVDTYPVVPGHWPQNQQEDRFAEWKQTMKDRAEEATRARKEIEAKANVWKSAAEKLASFLQAYPFEDYQAQKERLSELDQQIQKARTEQKELQKNIEEWENQTSTQQERIEQDTNEYNGLEVKVDKARDYLQQEKETNELKKSQEQLSKQISEYDRRRYRIQGQIERLTEEKDQLYEQERKAAYSDSLLMDESLYLEVKSYRPTFTNRSKSILTDIRQELQLDLRKLSTTRNEIQLQLTHTMKEIKRLSDGVEELLLDHGPLDEGVNFPVNGKELIADLREKMKDLEKTLESASIKFGKANENKIKQESVVEVALKQFIQAFPNEQPERFTTSLKEAKVDLNEEMQRLKEKRAYLQREQHRIDQELASISKAYHELDRFDEAHHFSGPSIHATTLGEGEIQTFTYGRIEFVKNVTNELKRGKEKVANELILVGKAKESFKSFCKLKITNVKMREMARQGIENKQTYQEVVEFHTHMKKRIQTVIKYNEESMINHDKELEQFVTHINSHLGTIADELALIPKKTKVKVEEKWKEIYKFSIPEWTEEEGKARIRKHVEWIMGQLESERFLTSEGQEDYGKVRKEIETWTHSKQLLRVVMNQEMIKVTCRKVTNDNQVTTRSYSWEQSNVWSGGEKWSKNMTLFLGILNYVAEKQKHIEANMKRHRVVIMDNPFGKASSDHVLNPVFFIAEQLGFQIIALTAHAEGKFLRDYFPVIYSCRLRKAADSTKQIMTKVKQLHQAYFKDHEPQALERLGEVEQMELF
ncbi:hypothetical protein [Bacillus sp. 2205SS5-2]|uniref:hypothetical protein n=1 Tax=Bacillus sp. 2205SS5-2 TaxID=3109031 RepID=UPI0030040929